jgi:hypothetical protein
MSSLSYLWESLNDFISLQGSKGAIMSTVFETLKMPEKIHKPFMMKLYASELYEFYDKKSLNGRRMVTLKDFQENHDLKLCDILCVTSAYSSWKAFGFESFYDIPDSSNSMNMAVIELLGMAREKGCSNVEISQLLGVPKLHQISDKLIIVGIASRKVIMPAGKKSNKSRVKSRTIILHLRRFGAAYDPTGDHVELECDDAAKEDINIYSRKLLDHFEIDHIASTDFAAAIGVPAKRLFKLKDSFANQLKVGVAGVAFDERECVLLYPGRNFKTSVKMRSCLVLVDGGEILTSGELHSVAMNAPLYEQTVAALRWKGEEGMSSTTIRVKMLLNTKRSARFVTELNVSHKYPLLRQQVGKTQANQLYYVTEAEMALGDGGANLQKKADKINDRKKTDILVDDDEEQIESSNPTAGSSSGSGSVSGSKSGSASGSKSGSASKSVSGSASGSVPGSGYPAGPDEASGSPRVDVKAERDTGRSDKKKEKEMSASMSQRFQTDLRTVRLKVIMDTLTQGNFFSRFLL